MEPAESTLNNNACVNMGFNSATVFRPLAVFLSTYQLVIDFLQRSTIDTHQYLVGLAGAVYTDGGPSDINDCRKLQGENF